MRIIYTLSFVLCAAVLFLGNSSGPGAVQGQDRTGSPVANGFCGNCHAVGAFNPTMTLEVLDNGQAVTDYMAGESYTVRITVNADMGAQVYGFQAVALHDNNDNAGSFTAGSGQQVTTLSGSRQYVEHSMRSQSNVFEFQWEAPASGSGNVNFYASVVAANNAQGSGGDGAARLDAPVVISDASVSTNDLPELATALTAFPNPATDRVQLKVSVATSTTAQVRMVNLFGQTLRLQTEQLVTGDNQLTLDLADLPAGQYVVEMSDELSASRTTIVKQ
ncbi:MAG: choice-of-anchor V domain-containing protein [Bacteroidota bacterium]